MSSATKELKHLQIVSGHYPQLMNTKEIKLQNMELHVKKHNPNHP